MRRAAIVSLLVVGVAAGYATRTFFEFHHEEAEVPASALDLPASPRPVASAAPQKQSAVKPSSPARAEGWHQAERDWPYLKLSSADWFLNKTRIADFGSELGRSEVLRSIDRWPHRRIEGCFSGEVHLTDGRLWKMHVVLRFQEAQAGAPLSGDVSVQLRENGNLFSNSNGSGEVRDLRTFGVDSGALILEASDTNFFQLYPVSDGSALVGNLYIRDEGKHFDFSGTAKLRRESCDSNGGGNS